MDVYADVLKRFEALGLAAKRKDAKGAEVDVISLPFSLAAPEVAVGGLAGAPPRGLTFEDGTKPESRLAELLLMARLEGIEVKDEAGFEERLLTFTASDETRDRYGDVILVDGKMTVEGKTKSYGKGWLLKDYRANPVFMPFHAHSAIPLGVAIDTWVEKEPRKRLRQTVLMATADVNPLAPQVLAAYKQRVLRTVSVGFMPVWSKVFVPHDEQEREAWNLGPQGYLFGEQELWENSAVAIPANPNAKLEGMTGEEAVRFVRFADEVKDAAPELAYQIRSALMSGAGFVDAPRREALTGDPAARDDHGDDPASPGSSEVLAALSATHRMVEQVMDALGAVEREVKTLRSTVEAKSGAPGDGAAQDSDDLYSGVFDGFKKLERAAERAPEKES